MNANQRLYTFFAFGKCPHCEFGWVTMDDQGPWSNLVEPCPMCPRGMGRSVEVVTGVTDPGRIKDTSTCEYRHRSQPNDPLTRMNRIGGPTTGDNYYHGVDVRALTWNRGYSLDHVRFCSEVDCHEPSTGGPCRCCSLPKDAKLVPRWSAIKRAARAASASEGPFPVWNDALAIEAEEFQRVEAGEYAKHLEQAHNEAGAA